MANNQHVNKVVFGAVSIIDITPTTAVESDVAQGKVFFKADGSQATGTNQGGSEDGSVTQDADGYIVLSDEPGTHVEVGSLSVTQNGTYTAPTGTAYSPVTVALPTTTHPNPTISVSSSGLITASHTQGSGVVTGGTTTATEQLSTQSAQTIHPSTTDQTIASGKYLTGTQTIKAVTTTNLVAENIAEGVTVKIGDSTDDDCVASIVGTHQGGTTPTGIKYVYSDIDGQGAWDVSGYAKCSFDYAPIRDNKARLWLKLTDNLSVSIKINIYSTTGVVDWGDGTQQEWTSSPLSHTYSASGLYVVEIQPTAGEMYFDLDNDVIGQTASNHDTRIVGAEFYSSNYNSTRYAFRYCDNLKKVSFIGAKIKNVGSNACTYCQSLEYVELPPTITTIQTGAFRYCSSLRKFTIPASVTSIQGYAFDSCSSLEEVHVLPLTPPTLDTYVFTNTSPDLKIYVPSASLSAYQSATNWSDYASKMVGE